MTGQAFTKVEGFEPLPERYGPWQTVYTRFRRWRIAGVWDRVLARVQQEADAAGQVDWSVHFVDSTDTAGVRFKHVSAPEKKYIVESMSGGVALFDYDNDGCLDIYFTNALTVETASDPKSSRSALYRNNCDGTFTDVTDHAGVGYAGWAMGVNPW